MDGDPYEVVMDSSEMASLQDVFNDLLKKKAAKLLSIRPLVFLERSQLRLRFDQTTAFASTKVDVHFWPLVGFFLMHGLKVCKSCLSL